MPNTKSMTETHQGGVTTIVTEIDGVKTTVTKSLVSTIYQGDMLAKVAYRQHKVWNPSTQAYVTVNMTGNQATDAAALAAAFVTVGTTSSTLISST